MRSPLQLSATTIEFCGVAGIEAHLHRKIDAHVADALPLSGLTSWAHS